MNFGTVISCSPHIVENIFKYLTAKDLSICASVCNLWAVVSREEIKRRKGIVPFFQGLKCGYHHQVHRTNQNCTMRRASKFESELRAQLEKVNIKPALCIAFATSGFLEHFELLFPSCFSTKPPRKLRKKCYWDYFDTAIKIALKKHLPSTCCISLSIENNVTFYSGDVSNLLETNTPALCGYLFPKFPDGELNFYKRNESTGKILKHIIANGPNIKSTLNLIDGVSMPYFQLALTELRHRHDAFATGIIMPVLKSNSYIPVFEGPNVQVFRFALNHVMSMEDNGLAEIMKQWKYEMELKKGLKDKTIAFLFSLEYDNCYKVCEIFKSVYSGVPLVGLFRYTPTYFRFEQLGIRDYFQNLVDRCVVESGLKFHCVLIFVTFNT